MRKLSKYLLLALMAIGIFVSCDKEQFTEEDAYEKEKELTELQDSLANNYLIVQDSLKKLGGIVQYTVNIYSVGGGATITKSTQADDVTGLTVTVAQNGMTSTQTLDETGMAVFSDMRVGNVSVAVTGEGFTNVNFVADITPRDEESNLPLIDQQGSYYDVTRNVATMIPVFPLSGPTVATIKGRVTYESDLTNDAPEAVSGAKVIATIDVDDASFKDRFLRFSEDSDEAGNDDGTDSNDDQIGSEDFTNYFGYNTFPGTIRELAYSDIAASATTDANGDYTLEVPSTADGLHYKFQVGDIVTNQTLFMYEKAGRVLDVANAEQSVRAVFSFDNNGVESNIPKVPAVYVEFSAPDGEVNFGPEVDATAVANLTESGVKAFRIADPGYGYTQAPTVHVYVEDADKGNVLPPSTPVDAEAVIDDFGRVTGITINDAGAGYLAGKEADYTVDFVTNTMDAAATAYTSFSLVGTFAEGEERINTTSAGSGYDIATPPTVTIEAPLATGGVQATATANLSGVIDPEEELLTAGGSNFIDDAEDNSFDSDIRVYMENAMNGNELSSVAGDFLVELEEVGSLYMVQLFGGPFVFDTSDVDVELEGGNGLNATLETVMEDEVIIAGITLDATDAIYIADGSEPAPIVTVLGDGTGCEISMSFVAGALVATLDDAGTGYTAAPTIVITDHPDNPNTGTGDFTIEFDLDYQLKEIVVTNGGNNFDDTKTDPILVFGPDRTLDLAAGADYNLIYGKAIKSIKVSPFSASNTGFEDVADLSIRVWDNNNMGSGATASPVLTYGVESITITNAGSGYYKGNRKPLVTIADPADGTTATLNLADGDLGKGKIQEIMITNPGDGYLAAPYIYLQNASASIDEDAGEYMGAFTAEVTDGKLTGITIDDAGMGYDATSYTVDINTFIDAADALLEVYPESGQVESVTILNPGRGYTTVPTVTFHAVDNLGNRIEDDLLLEAYGTGAAGTAVVEDGRVMSITVDNGGAGYYYTPDVDISVQSALKTAEGFATLDPKTGRVTGVNITDGGNGYETAPTITFTALDGVGSGAEAVAFLTGSTVTGVKMMNNGSGYLSRNYAVDAGDAYYSNGADPSGQNVAGVQPSVKTGAFNGEDADADGSNSVEITSGTVVITDIYMGTGKREIEHK